jgi:hypothetical protein
MLDEQLWLTLSDEDKIEEIQTCLDQLLAIDHGQHEFYGSNLQGRLVAVKKELQDRLFNIIDIENAI